MTNLEESKRLYRKHIAKEALAEEEKRRAIENKYARLLVMKCQKCDHTILLVDNRRHYPGQALHCSNCKQGGLILKDMSIIECVYEIPHLAGIGTPIASMQAFKLPDYLTPK